MMEKQLISFLLVIVLHSALWMTHVKGQSLWLLGSFAVRNETFQFRCAVDGIDPSQGRMSFQKGNGMTFYTVCNLNAGTCREISSLLPGYTCECVSGQTGVFYMNITSASTYDEGTWRCQFGGMNSNAISLDVLYGPGITSVPTNKHVIENASPGIDCSSNITSGNPPAKRSYRWTGPGGYSKDGAVLDRLVKRNQGGMYTCTAKNTAGLSDTAHVNVTVQYAPTVTSVPTNKNVTENASPDIDCGSNITPGNPSTTSYRWTGPGKYSKDGAVLDRLVNRNQGGVYTCTATNTAGLSDTAKVNINVHVQCSATGQSQPDRLGQGIGIGVGVSLPVVLVLVVIIVLMWRRNHEHIDTVNKDQTETIEIQSQGHSTPNQDGAYESLDEHAPQNNEYEKLDMANTDKEPVGMVEEESVYQNQGAVGVCEDNESGKETAEQE